MYYPRHNRKAYRRRRWLAITLDQIATGMCGGLIIGLLLCAPFFLP